MKTAIALTVLTVLALTGCEDNGKDPGYCAGHPNNSSVCSDDRPDE